MATIKVMLHKNWKHKSGTYPIVFQILHDRKKKILYTGYNVIETDFDVPRQKVVPSSQSSLSGRSAQKINTVIRNKRKALLQKIADYETQGIEYTVNNLDDNPPRQNNVWFLEYMEEQITTKRDTGNDGTADAYKSTRNSFRRFLKDKDVRVSEITPKLIRQYADFLSGGKVSENTAAYYMRNLKTIYNRAVTDGFKPTSAFPFRAIKTTKSKTPKRALSVKTLVCIAELKFDIVKEKHLELARDIFMFSYYCRGTAFVDIIRLEKSSIVAGVVAFSRQKGKQPIRISIIPEIEELMIKYSNNTNYIFPILDVNDCRPLYAQYKLALRRINYGLSIIGKSIGLEYPLTTYNARHSWATLVKELGTPISVISEGLGHSSEEMTRVYLKEFDTDVLDKVNMQAAKLEFK